MSPMLNIIKDTFTQFWDERQDRERLYIIVAVIVFVLMMIYLIGIDPALSGRDELRKSLPTLQVQSAEMQQMAQELAALPSPENLHDVTREYIDSTFAKDSIKPQSLSVVDGVVRAQIASTSMAALQTWLLEMQKSSGLFVDEMKITALEEGMISVTMTLRQSTSGG